MRAKPVLFRMEPRDHVRRYGIYGHRHLVAEGAYCEDVRGGVELYGWEVRDLRFRTALDQYDRGHVILLETLSEVRDWVRAGGPELWNPERRKADRKWRPVPPDMRTTGSGPGEVTGSAVE